MTPRKRSRFLELAICLAAMLHLWLFMGFSPLQRDSLTGAPVPPETSYTARSSESRPMEEGDVRMVWSPVLFSLPSEMGFSRDLLQEKLHSRLTFRQPDEPESFLAVRPAPRRRGAYINPGQLMVTTRRQKTLRPPSTSGAEPIRPPEARRVFIDPELKTRLVGGIVLPPELNQVTDPSWEVHADISISKQGDVRHVFLEQPLEAAAQNLAVIRMLRGLRFNPGTAPIEGRIEIYSARSGPGEGAGP